MIAEHLAGVQALLVLTPALTVYDTTVPDIPTYPYVVLRVGPRWESMTALTTATDRIEFRVQVTVVGANGASARIISDRVATALRDQRPTVAGRTCGPLRMAGDSSEFAPDLDVTLPGSTGHPIYANSLWEFLSIPA